jgi:hypothetical protein
MNNLQEATEKICEIKGNLIALDTLLTAILRTLPPDALRAIFFSFQTTAEVARITLVNSPISQLSIDAFEHDTSRSLRFLAACGCSVEGAATVDGDGDQHRCRSSP